jgi:hypothetical protein
MRSPRYAGFFGSWDLGCTETDPSHSPSRDPSQSPRCYTATLLPPQHRLRRQVHNKYTVEFEGELIASGGNAELDACRVLAKRGYHGKLHIIDGNTGRHRLTVDIAAGSRLTVKEGPHGPYFCKWRPSDRAATGEAAEEDE